jgi:hypothetical protein
MSWSLKAKELNCIKTILSRLLIVKEPKIRRLFRTIQAALSTSFDVIYGFVLHSFKSINRKIRSKLPVWRMEEETTEHVRFAVKVFKWIVLPVSLIYLTTTFLFFGENALDSTLWGVLLFFYSNFLPDLPSIYRRKKKNSGMTGELPWYKKYALLLFAPLLIWVLFSGLELAWRTTETFHNFKSLTVYGTFLFVLGVLGFVNFPFSIATLTKILSLPLYGIIGYLTHLKVDRIW